MYESAAMTGHYFTAGYMHDGPDVETTSHSLCSEGDKEYMALGYQHIGRSELLARIQSLESKLELSRTIGNKLLAQEEQYQAEVEDLQDKLWHMEEKLTALRLHNSSLIEELSTVRQDNVDLSARLSEAGELQRWASEQQNDQSWQQSAMQELHVQLNKLKLQNRDLQEQLTEMKIEAEARERIDSAFKDRAATGSQLRRRPVSAALSISRVSVADEPRRFPEPSEANGGEEETFEFSFEDQNQFDAAYLTQILDLEAQVEELSAQLEQQSIVMEDMKSDLAYYRSVTPFRARPTGASIDGSDPTISLAHELEALTGSASPVRRLDDTTEDIQSSELNSLMKSGLDDETCAVDTQTQSMGGVPKCRASTKQDMERSVLRHRRKPYSDMSGVGAHALHLPTDRSAEISELRIALAASCQAQETLTRDYNRLQLLTALLLVCTLFIFVAVQGLMYIATN